MNGPSTAATLKLPTGLWCGLAPNSCLRTSHSGRMGAELNMGVMHESHSECCSFVYVLQHDGSACCCEEDCWKFDPNLMLKVDEALTIWQRIWLISYIHLEVAARGHAIFQQVSDKVLQRGLIANEYNFTSAWRAAQFGLIMPNITLCNGLYTY